jgi:hypothetical protein
LEKSWFDGWTSVAHLFGSQEYKWKLSRHLVFVYFVMCAYTSIQTNQNSELILAVENVWCRRALFYKADHRRYQNQCIDSSEILISVVSTVLCFLAFLQILGVFERLGLMNWDVWRIFQNLLSCSMLWAILSQA